MIVIVSSAATLGNLNTKMFFCPYDHEVFLYCFRVNLYQQFFLSSFLKLFYLLSIKELGFKFLSTILPIRHCCPTINIIFPTIKDFYLFAIITE